ncbi:MAG: bifunctional adenosylcobinamide kinase/adenosylcobinamide-phosphate guanylyltransferase [Steroidobacteraceae bacterium]
MKTLVLGGMRSGKSRFAEALAHRSPKPVTVIATALAGDDEMRLRIAAHHAARPADWPVIEAPHRLAEALFDADRQRGTIVVECLTLWLAQLLERAETDALALEYTALLDVLPRLTSEVVLVSNETGLGVVPHGELSRRFLDTAGRLHQELAERCECVVFMVAGLPTVLKGAL